MAPGVEEGIIRGLYRFADAPQGPRRAGDHPLLAARHRRRPSRRSAVGRGLRRRRRAVVGHVVQGAAGGSACRRAVQPAPPVGAPDGPVRAPISSAASEGPVVAVTDFMKAVPDQIARWVPRRFTPLGTDGYGRSDTRAALRRHFETDAAHIVVAVLSALAGLGRGQGRGGGRRHRPLRHRPRSARPQGGVTVGLSWAGPASARAGLGTGPAAAPIAAASSRSSRAATR